MEEGDDHITLHATQKTVDGQKKRDWKGGRSAAITLSRAPRRRPGGRLPVRGQRQAHWDGSCVPTPTVSVFDLLQDRHGRASRDQGRDEKGERDLLSKGSLLHRERSLNDFIHDAKLALRRRQRLESNSKFLS